MNAVLKGIVLAAVGAACGAAGMQLVTLYRDANVAAELRERPLPRGSTSTLGDEARNLAPRATLATSAAVAAIAVSAEVDPAAAVAEALTLPDELEQKTAIRRVAALWAARDPLAALAYAAQLPARLRADFRAAVDGEWARLDTTGYLAYVEANPAYIEMLTGRAAFTADPVFLARSPGLRMLLASEPLAVLNLTDRVSSAFGAALKRTALAAYAELDPRAALAYVDTLPRGRLRNEALASVATGYALADPNAALAWARSLSPPSAQALQSTLLALARKDVQQAIDFVLQAYPQTISLANASAVVAVAAEDSMQAAFAAERLLATNLSKANSNTIFANLLARWAERDAESLISWLRSSAGRIREEALVGAASAIAASSPAAAASYTPRIPVELRATWIARVAGTYAGADPEGALTWLSQYAGQPGYDVGMRFAINAYATRDPAAAARALATAPPDVQRGSAGVVADRWARSDPPAAVEWSLALRDEPTRITAVGEAVGAWMSQRAQAAEDWTLRLPAGAVRDEALGVLLRGRSLSSSPRESYSTNPASTLIEKISDTELRRDAASWFAAPDAPGR